MSVCARQTDSIRTEIKDYIPKYSQRASSQEQPSHQRTHDQEGCKQLFQYQAPCK
jgi:hypothetical protein